MRISDWSSDVCSSDLYCCHVPGQCWLTSPSWGTDGQPSTDRILQIWKRSLVPPERGEGRASRSCVSCSRPFRLVRSDPRCGARSEEHTSELQSLMRISYAVFCLKKKKNTIHKINNEPSRYMHIVKSTNK